MIGRGGSLKPIRMVTRSPTVDKPCPATASPGHLRATNDATPTSSPCFLRRRHMSIGACYAHTFHSSLKDCHGCRPES